MLRQETVSETEVRLVVSGSLYGEAGIELERKLVSLFDSIYSTITLDLSKALGITSSTIGKLLAAHSHLSDQKRTIRIEGCSEVLYSLFQKIKLDTLIPINKMPTEGGA